MSLQETSGASNNAAHSESAILSSDLAEQDPTPFVLGCFCRCFWQSYAQEKFYLPAYTGSSRRQWKTQCTWKLLFHVLPTCSPGATVMVETLKRQKVPMTHPASCVTTENTFALKPVEEMLQPKVAINWGTPLDRITKWCL